MIWEHTFRVHRLCSGRLVGGFSGFRVGGCRLRDKAKLSRFGCSSRLRVVSWEEVVKPICV